VVSDQFIAIRGLNGQERVVNAGTVRSGTATAIDLGNGADTVTNSGAVSSGGAVTIALGAGADTLTLQTGSAIMGLVDAGTGTDALILQGSGQASNSFRAFETLTMQGADWTLGGTQAFGSSQISSGILRVAGLLTSPAAVQAGATLQVGTGGNVGVLAGNVTDNGSVIFNRNDAVIYGGTIGGSGSFSQAGTGTTILTGTNTYSGGTTITSGTLQIGNGGTAGSILGDTANNGALVFNRSDLLTYSGVISGSGSVSQNGAGEVRLTAANSAAGSVTSHRSSHHRPGSKLVQRPACDCRGFNRERDRYSCRYAPG